MSHKPRTHKVFIHRFSPPLQHLYAVLPVLVGLLFAFVFLSCSSAKLTSTSSQAGEWVGTWATGPQLVEPRNMPPEPGLSNNTLRQIVHVSLGGDSLRVKFSNEFGTSPVTIKAVHIAISEDSSAIEPNTDKALNFDGKPDVTIQPGIAVTSDPFGFELKPLSNVTITIYFGSTSPDVTGHPGSRTTSYILTGDKVSAADFPGAAKTDHWYIVKGIDVVAPKSAAAIVVLGNSITDGRGSGTNKQNRWPDELANRLQANPGTREVAVLNEGIGGNCVLQGGLGSTALSRFNRDVINQTKVRWLIILEGINDIGGARGPEASAIVADRLIDAYKWMIKTAHANGIEVYGATMTPFGGSFYDRPGHEEAWKKVNDWIRNSDSFDAVIDLDAAMRDPANPLHILPKDDSGDHLHPSEAGHKRMAEAVDLSLFK
jgi:lysophospholipase L1-like esterase